MTSISYQVPTTISSKIHVSNLYLNHTRSGRPSSYGVDLEFTKLRLFKKLKSSDLHVLQCKIESTLTSWAKSYDRELTAQHQERLQNNADQMNIDARNAVEALEGILKATLQVNDAVDWNAIKRKEHFQLDPKSTSLSSSDHFKYLTFDTRGKPESFIEDKPTTPPTLEGITNTYGLLSRIFRKGTIKEHYQDRQEIWKKSVQLVNETNEQRKKLLLSFQAYYAERHQQFETELAADNAAVDELRGRYEAGDPNSIEEYCDIVLTQSSYPRGIPRNWEVEYRTSNRLLLVQLDLPSPEDMPSVESYRYVKARDEVVEKKLSEAVRKRLYDNVVYQICLRTIHELIEADIISAIDTVAFNGVVTSRNLATGALESKIIVSISADRQYFETIDLANVDPKATFRHLKGTSATALHGLTPIAPIVQLDRNDKRIIEGRSIDVDHSDNLAAMNWEDF